MEPTKSDDSGGKHVRFPGMESTLSNDSGGKDGDDDGDRRADLMKALSYNCEVTSMRSLRELRVATSVNASIRESIMQAMRTEVHSGQSIRELEHGARGDHRIKIPFYSPPMQRQRWGEAQVLPHVNWGDLFFDLFYVAAAYNLGNLLVTGLASTLSFRAVVYFVGTFGPVWLIWFNKFLYDARFTVIDSAHRIIDIVRLCFLSLAVMHIKDFSVTSNEKHHAMFYFTLGVLLEAIVTIFLHVELVMVGQGDPELKSQSKRILKIGLVPVAICYLAAVAVAGLSYMDGDDESTNSESGSTGWGTTDIPIALCLIGYVFTQVALVFIPLYYKGHNRFEERTVPINVDFAIHRLGEWIMLMLGESVLSLLIVPVTDEAEYYLIVFFGILTVIMIQDLHFETQPSHADFHAMKRTHYAGVFYTLMIQIYSMALICFGVSFKVMLNMNYSQYEYDNNNPQGSRSLMQLMIEAKNRYLAGGGGYNVDTPEYQALSASLYCASLTIVLFSLELMALTHKGLKANLRRWVSPDASFLWKKRARISFVLWSAALLIFTATLSLYVTARWILVVVGSVVVSLFILTRMVGWEVFATKIR